MDIAYYGLLLGALFGFVLHRVGASNPDLIIDMLRLRNLHLMKVILSAIGVATILAFVAVEYSPELSKHFSIKSSYNGVVVGGLLLGLSWGISGYCPGTGVVALSEGRKHALAYLLGGLAGAFLYMVTYGDYIKGSFLEQKLGGSLTLANINKAGVDSVLNYPGCYVAIVIGIAFIIIAASLPKKLRG